MKKKGIMVFIILIASIVILSSSTTPNTSYGAGINDSSKISQDDVIKSSKSLYNYINKNKKLPENIKVEYKTYSTEEFMYLMSKTVINKKNNVKSDISIKNNIEKVKKSSRLNIKGTMSYKNIYTYSKNIAEYIDKNNKAPTSIKTKLGNMQYETMVYTWAKFLSKSNSKGQLPDKISISISKESPINNNGYTLRLFSNYEKGDSLKKYLLSTKNTPCKDKYIKELAKKITKDQNTTLQKAQAIFNWVKNNIKYSKYAYTKYGGKKTIKNRKGNCVDTSHALASLFRGSNIPARYVNGKCTFTKGELAKVTVAHVWVQVKINNKWVVADGIYKGNSLGYVANWKVNSYKHYGFFPNIYR
jgi:hypothetical protein